MIPVVLQFLSDWWWLQTLHRSESMVSLCFRSLINYIADDNLIGLQNFLENKRVQVDDRDENGSTALIVAASKGKLLFVRELVNHGADVNAEDADNWTALLCAAKEGFTDICVELLEHGADLEHRDLGGWTALMWATYKGRSETSALFLERGAEANAHGNYHISSLLWAAGRGYAAIARDLVRHGAKVNVGDKYGTTALVWASRKGNAEIVDCLLKAGANVDTAGMYSWTPLLVATLGNHIDVVNLLLEHRPNVNALDKDGCTALALACKEGFHEIAVALLNVGAYINIQDRAGDTNLIHAVKGGHRSVVEALLKKYADVDISGKDRKTAVYWSVEKGNAAMVRLLLSANPDLEIATKDGDTPLLRAVRTRNVEIVQLLLDKKAKVSAADKKGDTVLHIAMRARSKSLLGAQSVGWCRLYCPLLTSCLLPTQAIVEVLLRNPKNSQLLYRPNRGGETPYNIDMNHQKTILGQIFGARRLNTNEDNENMLGYDLYSSALADILSEPSLSMPITVGLYAKWGSGKSFLLNKLRGKVCVIPEEMKNFARQWVDPVFQFSSLLLIVVVHMALVIGTVVGLASRWWVAGVSAGGTIVVLCYTFLMLIWYGSQRYDWYWPYNFNVFLTRKLNSLRLILQVMFCHPPGANLNDGLAAQPIKFYFTDQTRVSSSTGGENSVVQMLGSLYDAIENDCGSIPTRLYRAFRPKSSKLGSLGVKSTSSWRWRRLCCLPYSVIFVLSFLFLLVGISVLTIYLMDLNNYSVADENIVVWCGVFQEQCVLSHSRNIVYCHVSGTMFTVMFQEHCGMLCSKNIVEQCVLSCSRNNVYCHVPETLWCVVFQKHCVRSCSRNIVYDHVTGTMFTVVFQEHCGIMCTVTFQEHCGVVFQKHCVQSCSRNIVVVVIEQTVAHVTLITIALLLCVGVVANLYTWGQMIQALLFSQRRHLQRAIARLDTLKSEGFLQALRSEVNLMTEMVKCVDSFTSQQTRLVVIVDGLDSCEQDKVLLVLDAVHMLFSDTTSPFIVILAIDPHIISKIASQAVEFNSRRLFSESNIGGHDYLRNMVHLPFYLQNSGLRKVKVAQQTAHHHRKSMSAWADAEETVGVPPSGPLSTMGGSRRMSTESGMSSSEKLKPPGGLIRKGSRKLKLSESIASSLGSNLNRVGGAHDLTKMLLTDDYFSDVNPRSMRRLMNVVYITGRLLKAFQIDFNWYHLASWVNITEQWPYRTSWVILHYSMHEESYDDNTSLKSLYDKLRPLIPLSKEVEPLLELDRDERKFDIFLTFHRSSLLISDLKIFLPFTINLDPYIKKVIKEDHQNMEEAGELQFMVPSPPAPLPPQAANTTTPIWGAQKSSLLRRQRTSTGSDERLGHQHWFRRASSAPGLVQTSVKRTRTGSDERLAHQHWRQLSRSATLQGPGAAYPQPSMVGWPPHWLSMQDSMSMMPRPSLYPQMSAVTVLPSEVLDVKLSSLSVDGVCDLFTKVEDLNSPSTPQYVSVMRENNISGRVLLHCDLEELKKVLQMNFGDWELFRMIVVSLREQELTCFSHQEELNYKNVRFAVPSPHATPQLPERKGLAPMFSLKNTRIFYTMSLSKSPSLPNDKDKSTSRSESRTTNKQSIMEKQEAQPFQTWYTSSHDQLCHTEFLSKGHEQSSAVVPSDELSGERVRQVTFWWASVRTGGNTSLLCRSVLTTTSTDARRSTTRNRPSRDQAKSIMVQGPRLPCGSRVYLLWMTYNPSLGHHKHKIPDSSQVASNFDT
uniref:KAP NTPase domain-containing protein n=1 Tax=Timema monikensis TaxID=170555 RepID=A0A7R9E9S3_9NEOP|nr:unnamed protein product [Timema monikensis]